MALQITELFSGPTSVGVQPRLAAKALIVARFGTGTALLPIGTPVARRASDEKWVPYTQPSDDASFTVTNAATDVDGGSFLVIIDGAAVQLAWNVTAAAAVTEINAVLLNAGRAYTVSAICSEANLGVAGAVLTVTFSESAGAPNLEYDGEDVTEGGVSEPHTFAITDAGTALDSSNKIRGFVYESTVQLDAADDVLGVVMVRGEAYASDVNTAAIRTVLGGSPSEAEVQAALKDQDLGARIQIRGLSGAF